MNDSPRTLTRKQVRELDRRAIEEFGIPGLVLMENAGRGVADLLCQLGVDGPVVICCGKGNNAGDGLVLARHLQLREVEFSLWTWFAANEWRGDAAANLAICKAAGIELRAAQDDEWHDGFSKSVTNADWVVDAMLGTGASGAPRSPLDTVIDVLNRSAAKKLAIDVSSGLDCDTGEVATVAFRADHTCTFVAPKPGLVVAGSKEYVGELHVADIGAPRVLVEAMLEG